MLPPDAVWIDLVKPTPGEDHAVERLVGIEIPTREEMQEIEISSRLYVENGARYMTATLMCAADSGTPRITPVTFILDQPPPGHRALRRAQALRAGREQARARLPRRGHRRNRADGTAGRA